MKFHDYTLLHGKIHTRRYMDTSVLDPAEIEICAGMLRKLRAGAEFVTHGSEFAPAFGVSLGPPDWLLQVGETVEAPGRFFCVAEPAMPAFQFNYILPAAEPTEVDRRACATAIALSFAAFGEEMPVHLRTEEGIQNQVDEITRQRPVVATAMIPAYKVDPRIYMIAASFNTCFSAAMFLEQIASD